MSPAGPTPMGYETASANDTWAQERINAPWSIKAREGGTYSLHDDDGGYRGTVDSEADAIFLAALVLDDARRRNPDRLPAHLCTPGGVVNTRLKRAENRLAWATFTAFDLNAGVKIDDPPEVASAKTTDARDMVATALDAYADARDAR